AAAPAGRPGGRGPPRRRAAEGTVSALDDAAEELRSRPVADVGHLLKPGGLGELEQEIAHLTASGLHAHVVVTPRGEALEPWHALWGRLGYRQDRDLLLLF